MNIYKITADKKFVEYDTYDSAIVVAHSEDEARRIRNDQDGHDMFWPQNVEDLTVIKIGVADNSIEFPVVLVASFNAG